MTDEQVFRDAPTGTSARVPAQAVVLVDSRSEVGKIDERIYGHFLESNFYGNIEGGVFDPTSPRALDGDGPTRGLRGDVIDLARGLRVPIVRWPGGNFASGYHWEDGIGPRERRPRRLDLAWGGEERNWFGTDEFLAWCAQVGCEPYLVNSARDVEEAVRWLEYTNYEGSTQYARRRAANGHPGAYGVRYWGIGNEVYGRWQLGSRTARRYARDAAEHARFMRAVDPTIALVAVGAPREHGWGEWARPLLAEAGSLIDFVSLHLYGASLHLAGRTDDEFTAVVTQAAHFEHELAAFSQLIESIAGEAGIDRRLSIALDEWNMRHLEPAAWPEPAPGPDGGVVPRDLPSQAGTGGATFAAPRVNRWSPRTLADALFTAGVFHALQRLAGRPVAPRLGTAVNLVNANAPIVARPGAALASATYPVWDLYRNHTGPIALEARVEGAPRRAAIRRSPRPNAEGEFPARVGEVPLLDVTATLSADRRRLRLAVVNPDPRQPVRGRIVLDSGVDGPPPHPLAWSIGDDTPDLWAVNTRDSTTVRVNGPRRVAVTEEGLVFPAHSITLLEWDRDPAMPDV